MMRRIAVAAALLGMLTACSKAATTAGSGPTGASATSAPAPAAATSAPPVAAGAVKYYDCASLLTAQDVQQATGLSDAKFLNEEKGQAIKGQTYCQFFGGNSVSIAASVNTGPAFTTVVEPLLAAGQVGASDVSGPWDEAKANNQGIVARVGSLGIAVLFANTGGGDLGMSDPQGAAVALAKLIASHL